MNLNIDFSSSIQIQVIVSEVNEVMITTIHKSLRTGFYSFLNNIHVYLERVNKKCE